MRVIKAIIYAFWRPQAMWYAFWMDVDVPYWQAFSEGLSPHEAALREHRED